MYVYARRPPATEVIGGRSGTSAAWARRGLLELVAGRQVDLLGVLPEPRAGDERGAVAQRVVGDQVRTALVAHEPGAAGGAAVHGAADHVLGRVVARVA